MVGVLVEKREAFHHPLIEPGARMARYLARDMGTLLQPYELGSRRRRVDRDVAILAAVCVPHLVMENDRQHGGRPRRCYTTHRPHETLIDLAVEKSKAFMHLVL